MTQQQKQAFRERIEYLKKELKEKGDYAIGMITCSVCDQKKLSDNFDLDEAVDIETGYIICNECINDAKCGECGNPEVLPIEEWSMPYNPECSECQSDRAKYEAEDYRDE